MLTCHLNHRKIMKVSGRWQVACWLHDVCDAVQFNGFKHHLCTDASLIFISICILSLKSHTHVHILLSIRTWGSCNHFPLCTLKTEALGFSPRRSSGHLPPKYAASVYWWFWAEGTWKIGNVGRSISELPPLPPKGAHCHKSSPGEPYQPGKIDSYHRTDEK